MADREDVERVAARVGERYPAVHLLVNNAGIPGGGGFLEVGPEQIERVTRTNYLGSVWSLLAFLPLLEADTPSDVVTIASVAGTVAVGASGPYTAAKHAQLAFSRSVTVELDPRGIRVHSILPGWVETDRFPDHNLRRKLPRWIVIQPDQVAEVVMNSIDHNRREAVVPWPFRAAVLLHGALPGTLGRVFSLVGGPERLRR